MKSAFKISFLLLLFRLHCSGQNQYPTQDSTHLFWQPNLTITKFDYQGKPHSEVSKLMDKFGFTAAASIGIWSALDVPKKKKDRKVKFEKVYFAPAFDKKASFLKTDDSLQIEMQNLMFDISEIWARWARKELQEIKDSTKSIGTVTIMYETIKKEMNQNRISLQNTYFKEVIVEKIDGAFEKWRKVIAKNLEETKRWATTPEECYRLMTRKPIEDDYMLAPTVMGPL